MEENDEIEVVAYTPEKIARELLIGKFDDSQRSIEILSAEKDDGNPYTFIFEILITIFMEIIFSLAKLDFHSKNEGVKFIPNYQELQLDELISMASDKLEHLKYITRVETYERSDLDCEEFKELADKRYCRVVLRYYENDPLFETSDDLYHIKLNAFADETKYKKLENVYCLIMLDKIYVIRFVPL